MSAHIVHFVPASVCHISKNCEDFIRLCREELEVFGKDLDWAAWWWPGAMFAKFGVPSRGITEDQLLDRDIMDFAKAYFRYQQGMKPTKAKNELKAIRVIEAALLQGGQRADIKLVDMIALDKADQLAREHYSPMAAYHAGRELERLAKFLTDKHLIRVPLASWQSSIRKPKDQAIQTGAQARSIQMQKMPSDNALCAMAEIFALNPKEPRDIFTSSAFAMSLCAPVRMSEILELPEDCEVEETDRRGVLRYGWRFYSMKGFEGNIKWIPSVMVPIAKEAVSRIRSLTEPARKLARWLEEHPHEFYRHAECPAVGNDVLLTVEQASRALGLQGLSNSGLTAKNGIYSLGSLLPWVHARQPEGFPWLSQRTQIRFSNGLFSMTRNLLHSQRGVSPVILWAPDINVFNNDMGPREALVAKHESIFDRFGYKLPDGGRMKISSHQARHLLNTLAKRGGMSDELLSKWSGRADKKQNRVYNHMNEFERVAAAEAVDPGRELFGPAGSLSGHGPLSVKDLEIMERGPLHITDYGVCRHDFVVSPCERFRDCLNCQEHICVKGADEKERRIRMRLAEVERDLAAAEAAMKMEYDGSDRWFDHQRRLAERLRELLAIIDDPSVADGALIKLGGGASYSHLGRALVDKLEIGGRSFSLLTGALALGKL